MSELAAEPRMLIDGKLVEAASGATYGNVNPATEEIAGEVADAGPDDMDRAIEAARRAFDETDWSTNPAFRQRCLQQLKDALDKEKETLRPQLVTEVGTPIMLTYAVQQDSCIEDMQWEIDLIDRYEWERALPAHEFMGMHSSRKVVHEPVGVVGAITPWNFPFMLNLSKLTPALAAGNTVVLKPAPDTPWSATFIGRLASEQTDIPPGVLNVVTSGDAATVGEMLTSDPRVDMVSFTGSTATGRRIMANGAETLKKVFLELGGKSANVILDDADFAAAVPSGSMICMHGGQGCAITTRMLLPKSHYDEAVDILKAAFESVPYGDPTDPGNIMGPLVNARQRDRVLGYIEKGKAEGAKLLVGGGRPEHLEKGYYVECRPRRHDRPGGDLRTRPVRAEVRRRRRRRAYRQQLDVRAVGLGDERVGRAGGGDCAAHPYGNSVRERRDVVRGRLAVRRIPAERQRARARDRRIRGVPRDEDARSSRKRIGREPQ